jgi:hypothetical protein
MSTQSPAGWHPDPMGTHEHRYWDGSQWTSHVADAGVLASAPTGAAPAVYAAGSTPLYPSMPKSKTTSVLLAVFLAFWTWLYTYKTDAWKFWLNLGLSIVTVGIWLIVAWIWAIIDVSVRSNDWYDLFPNGDALQRQAALAAGAAQLPAAATYATQPGVAPGIVPNVTMPVPPSAPAASTPMPMPVGRETPPEPDATPASDAPTEVQPPPPPPA